MSQTTIAKFTEYDRREIELALSNYLDGEFDGATGLLEPQYPHDLNYWTGYCQGLKQYWLKKKPAN